VHVRFLLAPELGVPLGPIAVWHSFLRPQPTLRGGAGALVVPSNGEREVRVIGALASAGSLAVVDPTGAVITRRTPGPAAVGAPVIQLLALSQPAAVTPFGASAGQVREEMNRPPDVLVGLPGTAKSPWYAGIVPVSEAFDRVAAGAPKRLSILDAPGGPFAALTPPDEQKRVAASTAVFGQLLGALLSPGPMPPGARVLTQKAEPPVPPNPPSSADIPIWGTLLMQAMDFGVARFLGLGTTLPWRQPQQGLMDGLWVATLFALPPGALLVDDPNAPPGTQQAVTVDWPVHPAEAGIIQRLQQLTPGLDTACAVAKAAGLTVRAALTAAAVPPLPDAPTIGAPEIGPARWITVDDAPSTAWSQGFSFGPMVSTVAGLAMASAQGGKPLHPRPPVQPGRRAQLMLIGETLDGARLAFDRVEGPGPVSYQFAAADLFGRFGPPRTVDVTAPARPPLPTPAPQVAVQRSHPGGTAPASPGVAVLTVPVPAIGSLAAGALPITGCTYRFDGGAPVDMPIAGGLATTEIALPALAPTEAGAWPIVVQFMAGALGSPTATVTVAVADLRGPPAIDAGPGIIWTSRAANAAETEVALSWPSASAAHVYEASAASLLAAVAPTLDPATLSRAGLAQLLAAKNASYGRQAFARLTVDPVQPGADGICRFTSTLPRSQRTVAFLKIVTVSSGGVESEFSQGGLVPIAVPDDLPPPPPRLTGALSEDGTAVTLTVEATGINRHRLAVLEPGLPPGTPMPGAVGDDAPHPPEFRLRRATGPVSDPLYARPLGGPKPLTVPAATADAPAAAFVDAGVEPFVPATWWAEVRMPPERVLPPGVASSGSVRPAYGWQRQPMAAPWSRLSAPVHLLPVPQGPPVLSAGQVTATQIAVPVSPQSPVMICATPRWA